MALLRQHSSSTAQSIDSREVYNYNKKVVFGAQNNCRRKSMAMDANSAEEFAVGSIKTTLGDEFEGQYMLETSHFNMGFFKHGMVAEMPPGYKFLPTDEELVTHYLTNKAFFKPLPAQVIQDIDATDLYSKPPMALGNSIFRFYTLQTLAVKGRGTSSSIWISIFMEEEKKFGWLEMESGSGGPWESKNRFITVMEMFLRPRSAFTISQEPHQRARKLIGKWKSIDRGMGIGKNKKGHRLHKLVEKEANEDMVTLSRIKSKDPSQRPFHV
ncbi:hypothetical protein RJ640_003277 [Escallonia rubra]|uniref:NAC domain-containing protein n=1 Tax=Escallonia rubra TaxID=112253 RepID=A0AA88QIN4_9ASTE|nr:hypothetical protein RJ640_003277 [Escallonia rubra]